MVKYHPIYYKWAKMKQRCNYPKYQFYHLYGGRGISYDPRWEKFGNFEKDMLSSYKNGLTLDRIDNNKGYSKENCRWATYQEQANNRRTSRFILYQGVIKTLTQWIDYLGLKKSTVSQRFYVYKWPVNKCFNYRR